MAAPALPPLIPTVHWAQSPTELFLKLDIRDARRETVKVKVGLGTQLCITATSQSGREYKLELPLHDAVMPTPRPQVLAGSVSVTLAKMEGESGQVKAEWPRLLADGMPLDKNKVKVDWDRFNSADIAEDAAATAAAAQEKIELSRAWAAESARLSGQPLPPSASSALPADITPEQAAALNLAGARQGMHVGMDPALLGLSWQRRMKSAYLVLYNVAVLLGVIFVLGLSIQLLWLNFFPKRVTVAAAAAALNAATSSAAASTSATAAATAASAGTGTSSAAASATASTLLHSGGWAGLLHGLRSVHGRVGGTELFVQGLASLEVVHALVGLTRGSVLPSFLLHAGRNIVLFGAILLAPSTHASAATGALFLLWCLGDLVRFLYYLMSLVGSDAAARATADNWLGKAVTMGLTHPGSLGKVSWARYTLPLLLMPAGFMAELAVLWTGASHEAGQVMLPGGVPLVALLYAYIAAAYLLGAPFLMWTVYKQRSSKLGVGGKAAHKVGKPATTTTVKTAAAKKTE